MVASTAIMGSLGTLWPACGSGAAAKAPSGMAAIVWLLLVAALRGKPVTWRRTRGRRRFFDRQNVLDQALSSSAWAGSTVAASSRCGLGTNDEHEFPRWWGLACNQGGHGWVTSMVAISSNCLASSRHRVTTLGITSAGRARASMRWGFKQDEAAQRGERVTQVVWRATPLAGQQAEKAKPGPQCRQQR